MNTSNFLSGSTFNNTQFWNSNMKLNSFLLGFPLFLCVSLKCSLLKSNIPLHVLYNLVLNMKYFKVIS